MFFSKKYFFLILILLSTSLLFFISGSNKLPDDIRYMLGDMYGEDQNKWPLSIYNKDLDDDGFEDWVVQNKNCDSIKTCPAELFICVPDKKGACSEYCYIEIKEPDNLEEKVTNMKCETTC